MWFVVVLPLVLVAVVVVFPIPYKEPKTTHDFWVNSVLSVFEGNAHYKVWMHRLDTDPKLSCIRNILPDKTDIRNRGDRVRLKEYQNTK